MKTYQEPEIEVTFFQAEAILLTSAAVPDDSFDDGTGDWA